MQQNEYKKLFELEKYFFWFRARRELILSLFRQRIGSQSDLLEVGCGTGETLVQARKIPNVTVFGFDISPQAVGSVEMFGGLYRAKVLWFVL